LLVLSVLALFTGPMLYYWLRRGGMIARAVDRAIVVALALVIAFLLVPEVVDGLGLLSLVLIGAGYLVPGLLEAAVRGAARAFHTISLLFALAGLMLHAALDGAGLAGSATQATAFLGLAIVMHRFSMGLALWLMVWPVFGRRAAAGVLLLVALATGTGYLLSSQLLTLQQGNAVLVLQSLIVGTILHSLLHREHAHFHAHQGH